MFSRILLVALLAACASAQIFASNNLLLRYSFDSLPPVDESSFQRGSPLANGAAEPATGKIGGGARFNAGGAVTQNANLDLYYAGQWNLTAPVTITAWFSIDNWAISTNADVYGKICSTKSSYTDNQGFEIQYNVNKKQWTILLPHPNGGSQDLTIPNRAYNAEEFHHIAVVISNNNAAAYIDGVLAGQRDYTPPLIGNRGKDLTIGGSATKQNVNQGGEWHGVIDELRIYNIALDAGQITAVFQQADLTQGNGGDGVTSPVTGSCPAARATAATPALTARADNLPKGADGNTVSAFPKNRVTLHRTKDQQDIIVQPWIPKTWDNTVVTHNRTTLTITNTADYAVQISAINVDQAGLFALNYPAVPATLNKGDTFVISILFNADRGDKGAVRTTLHVVSNDPAQQSLDVVLAGLFMLKPEGGNEVPLATIVTAFGFGVNIPIGWVDVIEEPNTPVLMDESPTEFFKAADPSKPIGIYQIAAFGGITNPVGTHDFHITYENTGAADCTLSLKNIWAQTILPECSNTAAQTCFTTCTPGTKRFSVMMDGQWTSVINNMAMDGKFIDDIAWRFFAARHADGSVIPDTYIGGQDYALPGGCCDGDGCANCDYQDNIYVLTNVNAAENPSQDNTLVPLPFSYSFNGSIEGNAVDQNGNGLPFHQRFYTHYETRLNTAYEPSQLLLNTNAKTLTINALPGSPIKQELVNAFVTKFDPQGNAFGASATIQSGFDNAAYAGVILGSDQKNFFVAYAHAGQVYAYATSVIPTQTAVFPTFTDKGAALGQATLPTGFSSLTLAISADPSTSKIYASYTADNQETVYFAVYNVPGMSAAFAGGSSGRLLGAGVGAGPVAWSDAGSLPVVFTNFAVSQCSGSTPISTGVSSTTSSTFSTSSTSSTESSSSSSTDSETSSTSAASSNGDSSNTETSNGETPVASSTTPEGTVINNDPAATQDRAQPEGSSASNSVPAMVAVAAAVVIAIMA